MKHRKIHKFPISRTADKFDIQIDPGFRFVRLQFQKDVLCMWAEIDASKVRQAMKFEFFGTGMAISESGQYLATYDDGPFVKHLYFMGGAAQ